MRHSLKHRESVTIGLNGASTVRHVVPSTDIIVSFLLRSISSEESLDPERGGSVYGVNSQMSFDPERLDFAKVPSFYDLTFFGFWGVHDRKRL